MSDLTAHSSSEVLVTRAAEVHPSATPLADEAFETSSAAWAYALRIPLPAALDPGDSLTVVVTLDVHVLDGRLGIGCLDASESAFIVERYVTSSPEPARVVLRADARTTTAVIVRNAREDGASRLRLIRAAVRHVRSASFRYPVDVASRDVAAETTPAGSQRQFDDDAADAINIARMDFIRSLGLPLQGRRVLDVGAGVGHFSRLYVSLGATVVAIDGRTENVEALRRRCPDVEAHAGDVQEMDLTRLGRFDVVHCFGLLYHLESPVAALRRFERICAGVLLLETIICDAAAPVMRLADETTAANQALAGLGCRPSPSFVAKALNRIGFARVYGAASPPAHPDFRFEWKNTLESSRDGHNLRCVFVASRTELHSDALLPLLGA